MVVTEKGSVLEEVLAQTAWLVYFESLTCTVSDLLTWVLETVGSLLQLWQMEQVLPLDTSFLKTFPKNSFSMLYLQDFHYGQPNLENGLPKTLMRFILLLIIND